SDLRSRRPGLSVDQIGVGDDHVRGLSLGASDFVRQFHQPTELGVGRRSKHDHSISEAKLRMSDRAILIGHDKLLFKAEDAAEPLDRSRRVAIAKTWDNCRSGIFWNCGHGFLLSAQCASRIRAASEAD